MSDKYEVTMMYRVHLPEGTEEALTKAFAGDYLAVELALSEILTELISEVMNDYQATTQTGKRTSDWVYLGDDHAEGEMWSQGWYNLTDLPGDWESTTVEQFSNWLAHKNNRYVLALVTGVEASNMSWIWEGE
jgi:hypothetical protein